MKKTSKNPETNPCRQNLAGPVLLGERHSRGTWKLHGESIATIVVSTTGKKGAETLFTFWVFH